MMKTYLVTGGAGFIGSHVVRLLLGEGFRVIVLDNLSSGSLDNLKYATVCGSEPEFINGDIRDMRLLDELLSGGVDGVFHLAALPSVEASISHPFASHEVNIGGTLNILEAARKNGVKRIVFSSSCAVYGNAVTGGACCECMSPEPASPYAVQKAASEKYIGVYSRLHGLRSVCLRYFNVYGPRQNPAGDYAAVVPLFIKAVKTGMPAVIYGDGRQTRDFVFVEDVARANLRAMQNDDLPQTVTFNIGSGRASSVLDLLHAVMGAAGSDIEINMAEARLGEVRHSLADITAARDMLKWSPVHDLYSGLACTVEKYEQTD